jgi:O-succinylbenzoic acid--CoA ligase
MRDWLAARARVSPDATALIDAGSGTRLSYAELDERARSAAKSLTERGLAAGDHVGIVLEVGPAAVSMVHAVSRLGAVLVPLSPRLTAEELRTRVRRADCEALVRDGSTAAAASAVGNVDVLALDAIGKETVGDDGSDPAGGAAASAPGETTDRTAAGGTATDGTTVGGRAVGGALADAEPIALDDPLVLLFTSGTTGQPKAVVLTAGNVLASAGASAVRLGTLPEDRWLLALSMGGMGGLAPIYRTVLYGTTLVLEREFDAHGTLETLSARACTGISLVPTMLSRLLDVIEEDGSEGDGENGETDETNGGSGGSEDGGDSEGVPASLRCVLLGGAPASRGLIERCRGSEVPVYPTYGMTETASQVATARPEEAFARPGTVGRPLFGVDVRAVGDGRVLDAGEEGELVVSGPIVTPGYYDDPEATAAAVSEVGLHTGDRGYVDGDGRVWVTGRADDRIVTGGQTIDPEEVAGTLRAHPGVREAAVVGLDSEQWGERVGALIVGEEPEAGGTGADGIGASAAELEAFCRERLAGYKLPRTIAFADRLPRTGSGTVDRVTVAERLSDADANGER